MITRKIDRDDALAGFTYHWVKKLGQKVEQLKVICLEKGNLGSLSKNVKVFSLDKERYSSHSHFIRRLVLYYNFQRLALKLLPQIDGVFCHQNPEYTICIAPLAKLFSRKIITWYTHKQVTWKLDLVNYLADKILTASEESCRLKNRRKIEVVGHGIDVEIFKPLSQISDFKPQTFKILSIGRISPIKNYQTLIEAIEILVKYKWIDNLEVQIIGGPGLKEHQVYFDQLKQSVRDKNLENYIKFLGPIPHSQIIPYYQNSHLFVNLSQTGSLDKAVLEAMACQNLILTCNEAFFSLLQDKRLIFQPKKAPDLAEKISKIIFLSKEEKKKIREKLREEVVKNHNLDKLIEQIIKGFVQNYKAKP